MANEWSGYITADSQRRVNSSEVCCKGASIRTTKRYYWTASGIVFLEYVLTSECMECAGENAGEPTSF